MKEEDVRAMLKKQGYNVPPSATFIDLDAQNVLEVKTGGWTDDQIRGKSESEIKEMINQQDILIDTFRTNLRDSEDRLYDLRAILRRKQQIGD